MKVLLLFEFIVFLLYTTINHPTKAGGEFDWGGTSAKK